MQKQESMLKEIRATENKKDKKKVIEMMTIPVRLDEILEEEQKKACLRDMIPGHIQKR